MDEKRISIIDNIKYVLINIHEASKGWIALTIIKNALEKSFYAVFFVYLIKYIFDSIAYGISFKVVCTTILILFSIHIILDLITVQYDYEFLRRKPILFSYMYTKVLKRSLKIPLKYVESPEYYDSYARALDGAQDNMELILRDIGDIVAQIARILVLLIFLLKLDPITLLFPLIPIINSLFIQIKKSKVIYSKNNEIIKYDRRLDYCRRVFYEKKYAEEIRVYPILKNIMGIHKDAIKNKEGITKKYAIKLVLLDIWEKVVLRIFLLIIATAYITYSILVKKNISIGGYASIIAAISNISYAVGYLLLYINELTGHATRTQYLKEFLESDTYEKDKNESNTKAKAKEEVHSQIALRNVSFQYYQAQKKIINHVSIDIKKGQKIALVGFNGAGKSTLVKLILALYEPVEGEVLFEGRDLRGIEKETYYKKVSAVFQDFQIYSVPIINNVLMKEEYTPEEEKMAIQALEQVGMLEKINKLKHGIHTVITKEFCSDGVVFSGGELQKIAVARVFVNQQAEVIILDEPSSALDPISEYNLYHTIFSYFEDKTVIFVSHRLTTAKAADYIYMLDGGKISESGTHEQLMENESTYYAMYNAQNQQ